MLPRPEEEHFLSGPMTGTVTTTHDRYKYKPFLVLKISPMYVFVYRGVPCERDARRGKRRAEDPLELELETRDGCYPTMLPPDVTGSSPHKRFLRVVSPKRLT